MPQAGQEQSFDMLVEFTKDEDPQARALAIMGLARTGDPRAFAPVVVALFDPVDEVRTACAAALGALGDARAFEPLLEGLKDPCEQTAVNCVWALGQIGARRCMDELLELLADDTRPAYIRVAAATAMGERCEKQGSDIVLHEAVQERARARLLDAAQAGDAELRAAAIWSLGHLPFDATTVRACIASLEDGDEWVVRYAVEALANFRAAEAEGALEKLAAGLDATLAALAGQALQAIRKRP